MVLVHHKTEFFIHCNKYVISKIKDLSINIGGVQVLSAKSIRSVGITKDVTLSWNDHIKITVKKCYKTLWALRGLRNNLSKENLKLLIQSLVLS